VTETINTEDLTVRDLFSQAELEKVDYDPEIAAIYCQYIMEGRSMLGAAMGCYETEHQDESFESDDPDEHRMLQADLKRRGAILQKKFARWRVTVEKFDQMVNLAMKQRCYAYIEDIIEIADDATDDAVMGAMGPTINGKAIRRAELMINTRKFVAGKLLPKVFGDKTQMELTGPDGKELAPTTFNIQLIPQGNFVSEEAALREAEIRDAGPAGTS
jgi:hypothetical protein